eukprot:5466526-Amphidinium_carterae.1
MELSRAALHSHAETCAARRLNEKFPRSLHFDILFPRRQHYCQSQVEPFVKPLKACVLVISLSGHAGTLLMRCQHGAVHL